jgi:DNA-binding beta-propeller fold protein YncE
MKISAALIVLLACGVGSLMASQGYIMPWCNPNTGEIEIYQVPPLDIPFHPSIKVKDFDFGPLKIDLGIGPFDIGIPKQIPDTGNAMKIPSPLNGKDCKYAKGKFTLGHPYEMSDPIAQKLKTGAFVIRPAAAAASNVSLINTFPYTVPLPLALPVTFPIPAGVTSANCDGSIGVYQVENDLDTVLHISLCPPHQISAIPVCSSPLETAVTPDGSTLLVTCYNNAIAWIDTASDKVTFTLHTLNAYPAGIAISPDGTRAYVTNYFDFDPNPSLLVIDVANKTILNTIPMPNAFPGVAAITPDGSQVWVNYYQSSFVDVVDTLSATVIARLDLQENAQNGMAFNPTGTKAFIAAGTSDLAIVDTSTFQLISKVTVAATPLDVVMTPDGTQVLVGSYSSGVISLVDANLNTLIQNFTLVSGSAQGLNVLLGSLPFP